MKKKMKLVVYGIGGGKMIVGPSGDCLVGTAHDLVTFDSLLNFVTLKGGYAVSLHGTIDGSTVSGEYSMEAARSRFLVVAIHAKR